MPLCAPGSATAWGLMNEHRKPLLTLVVTATAAVACVSAITIWHISKGYERDIFAQLEALVSTQARVIEAAAALEARHGSSSRPESVTSNAIDQLIDANRELRGLGETGEFMVARREGNTIEFLINRRFEGQEIPSALSYNSRQAEPMRKALQGMSGSMIGLDYRGHRVMAAYQPVESLSWGLVAKIDLAEVRHPVTMAAAAAALATLMIGVAGALIVSRSERPRITRALDDSPKLASIEAPETVVAAISTELIDSVGEEVDRLVNEALETVGTFMHADRCYLIAVSMARNAARFTHEWNDEEADSVKAVLGEVPLSSYPFKWGNLESGSLLHVPNLHLLPDQGVFEIGALQREGGESYLVVSTASSQRATYVLGFDTVHDPEKWPDAAESVLIAVTELVSRALIRQRRHEEESYEHELEALVPEAASKLLRQPPDTVTRAIEKTLGRLCEATGADRCYVASFTDEADTVTVFGEAGAPAEDADILGKTLISDDHAYTVGTVLRGDTLTVCAPTEVPAPVGREKAELHAADTQAWAVVPIRRGDKIAGMLGLDCLRTDAAWCLPSWPEQGVELLSNVGDLALAALSAGDTKAAPADQSASDSILAALPGIAYRSNNDADSPLEFISDGCRELTGYDREAYLSGEMTLARLVDPELAEQVRDDVQQALDNGTDYELVYRILDASGQQKWIWDRGAGVYDEQGRLDGLQGYLTDITNVKLAEDELRSSEERMRLAIDAAGLALWEWDLESGAMWWSGVLTEMLGSSTDDFEPSIFDFEECLHPEDRGRALGELRSCADAAADFSVECRLIDPDGSYHDVTLEGRPILDEEERTVRLAGSVVLREQTGVGAQGDSAGGLEDAKEFTVEAVEAFAGGIARDLEELLGPMMGEVNLEGTKATEEDFDLQMHLKHIVEGGKRAKRLVDQLRSIGAASDGEPVELDLRGTVETAIERANQADCGEVPIKRKLAKSGTQMLGHTADLEEMIANLCVNACEAASETDGSVIVELRAEAFPPSPTGAEAESHSGACLRLTVEDDGPGMDEETAARMFDPFFTTKSDGESSGRWAGLGLNVVQGIVRAHGGTITVDTSPGEGTRIDVRLPTGAEAGEASRTASEHKVLLVAADAAVLDAVRSMLATRGYAITALIDSRDALRVFTSSPYDYDVVVLDYALPRLNGAELAREMVRVRKDVPIIVSPGFKQAVAGKNQSAGQRGKKDYDIGDLGKAIEMALADKPGA